LIGPIFKTLLSDQSGRDYVHFLQRAAGEGHPDSFRMGMIAAAAGLMLVGVFFAVRRRKAAL
jgi:hypothetical protein